MQEISISNYFLTAVVKHAPEKGVNVPNLLNRAKIPIKLLSERGSRVTAEQFATLQSMAMREMNDEMLGYSPSPLKIGTWSMQCHWLIQSKNLGHALRRFCYFYAAMDRGFSVSLSTSEDCRKVIFQVETDEGDIDPYCFELFMFCLHRFSCWLIEDNLPIRKVWLNYPEPDHKQEYRALFPRTECVFDQAECAMFFDRALMETPIAQTPESLAQFLRQPLLNILVNDYHQQSWTAKTQNILKDNLENLPTLEQVADRLSIHPKKLCRNLEAEGIGYVELKSQLRRDMAIRYLVKTGEPIEQVAYLVGFSEACTFSRAFKKWTGVTPYTYRKSAKK